MTTQRLDTVGAHKRANLMQTAALLAGMALLLAGCGWLVAGGEGATWAVLAAGLGVLLAPRVSPRLVLGLFGARRLSPAAAPALFEAVAVLADRAGLARPPEIHYIPSAALNAFAVGRRDDAAIAVTDGLLRVLSLRELAAVLAHEIAHIRNDDMLVMGIADMAAGLTRLMSLVGMALLLLNLPLLALEREPVPWLLAVVLMLAPSLGALLQLALSRTREYDADLDAATLTGDPVGLASALERIERAQGGLWEGAFWPRRRRSADPSLLRSHPETTERIRRLLDLAPPVPPQPPPPQPPPERARVTAPVALPFPVVVRRPRRRLHGVWY